MSESEVILGNTGMTVQEALSEAIAALTAAGVPSPDFDAKALLAEVSTAGGIARLATCRTQEIPPDALVIFHSALLRRCNREPLQYILGYTEFYGLRLKCDPRALIPRPDTETLVEEVLGAVLESLGSITHLADIGTGTGAIAIALAHHTEPGGRANHRAHEVHLWATDVSAEALFLAGENVASHGLEGRITLLQGDCLAPLFEAGVAGRIEALVSNPPYVTPTEYPALEPEIVSHEPRQALVGGGEDGLGFYRKLMAQARKLPALRLVAFEVGAGQADAVAGIIADALEGFNISRKNDLQGVERVVLARRSNV